MLIPPTATLIRSFRLLADHGQFYAHDASIDPWDSLPTITEEVTRRGWARSEHAVHYYTVGNLWDFRLDLYQAQEPPTLDGADRVLAHTLLLPTGVLTVGNPIADDNVLTYALRPGEYALYLRAFHLGAESAEELNDDEFLGRSDLERYELFVVPGATPTEGVILGRATLW